MPPKDIPVAQCVSACWQRRAQPAGRASGATRFVPQGNRGGKAGFWPLPHTQGSEDQLPHDVQCLGFS